jgi:transcriptional regulator with XRE-family HTH domain
MHRPRGGGMSNGGVRSETIGALLAHVRSDQGISQLRLAERLCAASGQPTVTRHEVSRWEREERIPTGYWLGWLAAVLDLPLTELERAANAARRARHGGRPAHWIELSTGVYMRAS